MNDDDALRRARRREAQVAAASLPREALTDQLWMRVGAAPRREPRWRAPVAWAVGLTLAAIAGVMFWVTWFVLMPLVLP